MKLAALILALSLLTLARAADDETWRWQHPEPITYASLLAWHQRGALKGRGPLERSLDLNGDGAAEIFLAHSAYSRGMTYALFTHTKQGWKLLSTEIEGNSPFELLQTKHGEWHDFLSIVPTWRGRGFWRFRYTHSGSTYDLKKDCEVYDKDLSKP